MRWTDGREGGRGLSWREEGGAREEAQRSPAGGMSVQQGAVRKRGSGSLPCGPSPPPVGPAGAAGRARSPACRRRQEAGSKGQVGAQVGACRSTFAGYALLGRCMALACPLLHCLPRRPQGLQWLQNYVCQHSPVLFPRWQLIVLPLYGLPVQMVLMDLVLAGAQVRLGVGEQAWAGRAAGGGVGTFYG